MARDIEILRSDLGITHNDGVKSVLTTNGWTLGDD